MTDDLDALRAAMDRATPTPDPAKKAADLALAQKKFEDLQGSRVEARPTSERRWTARISDGVKAMFSGMTTRGGLTATTALVAVGLFFVIPEGSNILKPLGSDQGQVVEEIPAVAPEADDATAPIGKTAAGQTTIGNVTARSLRQDQPAEPMMEALTASDAASDNFAGGATAAAPLSRTRIAEESLVIAPSPDIVRSPESDTEAFANEDTNPLKIVGEDPVSTFSIDVDTASYGVVRSSLMQGYLPPAAAVRVEEMVNYFPYDYAAPDGEHPFQPTVSVVPTPWNDGTQLVHIAVQGEMPALDDRPPLNLVFLIDTSGSMQDANKLPLLKQSFRLMLSELRPEDQVAIVTYAGSAGQVLAPTKAEDRATIMAALDRLRLVAPPPGNKACNRPMPPQRRWLMTAMSHGFFWQRTGILMSGCRTLMR